jgi:hypothetical protein
METTLLFQNVHGQWKITKEVPPGTVVTSEDQVSENASQELVGKCEAVVAEVLKDLPHLHELTISSVHLTFSDVEPPRGIINIEKEKESPFVQVRFFEGQVFEG